MGRLSFKAFLSHRYKSPEVNLYFHGLFAELDEVQFDVDVGVSSTNVTRLERMIRDADAFIGIYPYKGDPLQVAETADLLKESRYFRLEVELATRARKPSLVFLDRRFAPQFELPSFMRREFFDAQEVMGRGGSPRRDLYLRRMTEFCQEVRSSMAACVDRLPSISEMQVGIAVPGDGPGRYAEEELAVIQDALGAQVASMARLPWPGMPGDGHLAAIDQCDWVVADVGREAMTGGLVGYLHGRFVPMVRLLKLADGESGDDVVAAHPLYGADRVGYKKDVVAWHTTEQLERALDSRIRTLLAPTRRISTNQDATSYFTEAALRKENVFVSYSGKDEHLARELIAELKKRFQKVFDYKDGESITPGQPWLEEIFDTLAGSSLGIPLVSSSYFASGNCDHEAQAMVARRDMNEMAMIPLKLYRDDSFERPSWMQNRQYMHYYDYENVPTLVDRLIEFYDRSRHAGARPGDPNPRVRA